MTLDDLGAVEEAVGDDVVDLAGLGAEDAGEVEGLIAGEGGGGGGPGVGDEAAAGHDWSSCTLGGGEVWRVRGVGGRVTSVLRSISTVWRP